MAEEEANSKVKTLEELQGKITAIKYLSVVSITIGIITFNFGILTVSLMIGNQSYPYSSGSGIYTGLEVIVLGAFGFVLTKEARAPRSAKRFKVFNILFRVFISLGIDVGAIHFAFGIWSLILCQQNSAQCAGPYHAGIFLTAGINLCFGFTVLILAITTLIVSWPVNRAFWAMAKVMPAHSDIEEVKDGTKQT